MWKVSASSQEGHKLLWSEQGGKPESLSRWSMRLQTVLQYIQPRLAMLKKLKHYPDDEDMTKVMFRAIQHGHKMLFSFLKARLLNRVLLWKDLSFNQLGLVVVEARDQVIIFNKHRDSEAPVKSLSLKPPGARKLTNPKAPYNVKTPFSTYRNQNVSGARSNVRFASKAILPADVLAINGDASPNRSASKSTDCRTCGSSDHISNRCSSQKIRCFQFVKDGKCEYDARCKFRYLQVDEVLSVRDYQSLEEVSGEIWREQQDDQDPGKSAAEKDYELSLQQDTAAAITDDDGAG